MSGAVTRAPPDVGIINRTRQAESTEVEGLPDLLRRLADQVHADPQLGKELLAVLRAGLAPSYTAPTGRLGPHQSPRGRSGRKPKPVLKTKRARAWIEARRMVKEGELTRDQFDQVVDWIRKADGWISRETLANIASSTEGKLVASEISPEKRETYRRLILAITKTR